MDVFGFLKNKSKVKVYSATEVDNKLKNIKMPTKTSELTNDSNFITSDDIPAIPSKTSDLQNDSGFITELKISSIVPTKHTVLSSVNVNPNENKTGTITVTKEGYYPLGIAGWEGISTEFNITNASLGSASIYYKATNGNPNTITCYLNVTILWVKLGE